jgi:hypothetical protein
VQGRDALGGRLGARSVRAVIARRRERQLDLERALGFDARGVGARGISVRVLQLEQQLALRRGEIARQRQASRWPRTAEGEGKPRGISFSRRKLHFTARTQRSS